MDAKPAARSGTLVTASFDDGHPLDMKVAERLATRGMTGTFYVAWNHPKGPEISAADVRELRTMGMEIGSHTWTHRLLTGRPRAEVVDELTRSRTALEDLLGEPVTSLSYPEGCFSAMIRAAAAECGYRLARTTRAYRVSKATDPLRMPITVMMLPLTKYQHVRHALRDANVSGLLSWWRHTRGDTDLASQAHAFFAAVIERGGVFHLYARSWQLEQLGLWEAFDHVLDHVSRWEGVGYVANRDAAG
jgi:peptidoglycan/xylan/chitin deacetylase (PgdA/CDA1 family)